MRAPVFALGVATALASLGGCGPSLPTGSCVLDVADSPVRGRADAWVTVVEFADFECPYCKLTVSTFDQLATEYPDDLRLAYENFPLAFHDRAFPAAKAGWCAHEQGRFWDMYERLYAAQTSGSADTYFSDSALASYASDLALDPTLFAGCMADPATDARIQADVRLGDAAQVSGTPTFFVNGKRLTGALPIYDFRTAIDDARTEAEASGIARANYYASLLEGGCNL